MNEWLRLVVDIVGTLIPLWIYMRIERTKLQKVQDMRHEQNQEKLDAILNERIYLPLHWHTETGNEPLTARGIIRKPRA